LKHETAIMNQPKINTHVLKMQCGVTVTIKLRDKPFEMTCYWEPVPPFARDLAERVIVEYMPWRDEILRDWAKRSNTRLLVIDA
jgi:hypothetical protein